MATLGRWTGSPALFPTTSWAAPNGLFPTQARNDGSAYTFTSSTSTLTLPSSGLADGYLMIARVHIDCSHNNRNTNQDRILQTGGTGNFANLQAGSYERNNNNDENYSLCMAFVDNPSASATFQYSWRREVGDGTPAGAVTRASFDVIPLYYSDVGIYTSTTAELLGGTTPNAADISTTTLEGTNITRSGTTVSVTGDNKRYMVLGSHYAEGRGGRTQRWVGPIYDSTLKRSATSYQYWRDAGTDNLGVCFTDIMETVTATRTIQLGVYRGDGVAANQGGADVDGSTPSAALNTLVVLELNDSAEVFKTEDGTGGQDLIAATRTDLNISRTTDIEFNDSASWTRASDTAMNAEQAMDALVGATAGGAYNLASSATRATGRCDLTVNGTEDADVYHGGYGRGNQSSTDTFGYSANPVGFVGLSSGDDVGFSVVNEGDSGPVDSQADWVGAWGINLDTLEGGASEDYSGSATISGGGTIVGSATRTEGHDGTATIAANGVVTTQPQKGALQSNAVSGGGTIVITATRTENRDATVTLNGGGAISINQQKHAEQFTTITANGIVAVTGSAEEAASGTATIAAGGAVTVNAQGNRIDGAVITGGGAIAISSERTEPHLGTSTIAGGGAVTVTGSADEAHSGTASITGNGTITVTATRTEGYDGSCAISGGGTVAVGITTNRVSLPVISANGVIGVTADRTENHDGTASVSGNGVVTTVGTADETHSGIATITGGGSVTATHAPGDARQIVISGSGATVVVGTTQRQQSVAITGGGTISASAGSSETHDGTATISGGGGVNCESSKNANDACIVSSQTGALVTSIKGASNVISITTGASLNTITSSQRSANAAVIGGGTVIASILQGVPADIVDVEHLQGRVIATNLLGYVIDQDIAISA